MTQQIFVFEVSTGDEKLRDQKGFRKDTMPIIMALEEKGIEAKVLFYSKESEESIREQVKTASAIINRVNPGNIPGGEKNYFDFLNSLVDRGIPVYADPKTMLSFGAKDALSKLAGSPIVPENTYSYYDTKEFKEKFPKTLSLGARVLKQNRGSQGSGIWIVKVSPDFSGSINHETPILCTEAVDNHTEERKLGEFMDFCEQYIVGENGMLVDMEFLPRISEGEIRIYMIGENPVLVIHKKPAEGSISATLGSGAIYTEATPEDWPKLMSMFKETLPKVKTLLDVSQTPLIWTADFILKTDENGEDTYCLGEFNCSCVGFTTMLDKGIQKKIADEVVARIS
jgi:glutathione synthase/RimK-type ligase-like ATP-grasp enzyme